MKNIHSPPAFAAMYGMGFYSTSISLGSTANDGVGITDLGRGHLTNK